MKHQAAALLLAASLALGAQGALAQETTYVFPYEGFRYTQKANETVLTQTNLHEHEELIEALGTTSEAILASYIASGIVMEVIPDDGGQIAVGVTDAGEFADVKDMSELDDERLAAFENQFAESGLYESCELTGTEPVCVRLTSSAMYASMPVYTLRYATLHLGRLYMITQTIVGRAPEAADDERMAQVLSGMKLLSSVTAPTPSPTPTPAPTPTATPAPTPGVAEVIASEGEMTVEGVPAYTTDANISITGKTEPTAAVRVAVGDKTLGKATAKKDGTFSLNVKLPEQGDLVLAVMTDTAEAMLSVRYEMPAAQIEITEPAEPVFTGESVTLRGKTEPEATVYITGGDMNTNVHSDKRGNFSIRVNMKDEGTQTYTLRVKAQGVQESTMDVTLTRVLTEREGISKFRSTMGPLEYDALAKDPQKYAQKNFSFRGKVMEFTDYDGSPCALVCVNNPSVGVWQDPVWIVLTGEEEITEQDVATFYLVGEGITLPAAGEYTGDGTETEAPVARAAYCMDVKTPETK